jgi:hypothetical protein
MLKSDIPITCGFFPQSQNFVIRGLLKHNIITLNHCLELTANKNSNLIFEIDSIFRNQLKIIQDQYKFYNF